MARRHSSYRRKEFARIAAARGDDVAAKMAEVTPQTIRKWRKAYNYDMPDVVEAPADGDTPPWLQRASSREILQPGGELSGRYVGVLADRAYAEDIRAGISWIMSDECFTDTAVDEDAVLATLRLSSLLSNAVPHDIRYGSSEAREAILNSSQLAEMLIVGHNECAVHSETVTCLCNDRAMKHKAGFCPRHASEANVPWQHVFKVALEWAKSQSEPISVHDLCDLSVDIRSVASQYISGVENMNERRADIAKFHNLWDS